jgi:hypothetical protein
MPMQPRLPGGNDRRDAALDLALHEVVPGLALIDRPDQPDGLITAVRRIPAASTRG